MDKQQLTDGLIRISCLLVWLMLPYNYIQHGLSGVIFWVQIVVLVSMTFYIIKFVRMTHDERLDVFGEISFIHFIFVGLCIGFYLMFWGLIDPSRIGNRCGD